MVTQIGIGDWTTLKLSSVLLRIDVIPGFAELVRKVGLPRLQ